MQKPSRKSLIKTTGKVLLVLSAAILLAIWLILTPDGLLGKADAIGYAVCHRIALRSFFLGDRQISLCARCSGMFLGMLVGLLYQLPYGKRAKLPPLKILIPFGLFFITFGIDGVNSYLHFFPEAPWLYEPHNFLRLATGTGLGVLVSIVLLPVVHQTLWKDVNDRPLIEGWPQALGLLAAAGLAALAMYSQNTLLLYPLALLSTAAVPLVLTLCYSLLWVILFHKENAYGHLREAWVPLLAGFVVALLQIGLIDWLRYWLTGTWGGFQL
jgi:uncharacterized membrane protein